MDAAAKDDEGVWDDKAEDDDLGGSCNLHVFGLHVGTVKPLAGRRSGFVLVPCSPVLSELSPTLHQLKTAESRSWIAH